MSVTRRSAAACRVHSEGSRAAPRTPTSVAVQFEIRAGLGDVFRDLIGILSSPDVNDPVTDGRQALLPHSPPFCLTDVERRARLEIFGPDS